MFSKSHNHKVIFDNINKFFINMNIYKKTFLFNIIANA